MKTFVVSMSGRRSVPRRQRRLSGVSVETVKLQQKIFESKGRYSRIRRVFSNRKEYWFDLETSY